MELRVQFVIGFLILYLDWSMIIGVISAAGIVAGAWTQDRRRERAEKAEAAGLETRLANLRHDIGDLEIQAETLEGIIVAHGEALKELKNAR